MYSTSAIQIALTPDKIGGILPGMMISSVFSALGGAAEVGRTIGVTTEHAAGMARRGSIPVVYWPKLVAAARERRLSWITYETLTHLHAAPDRARKRKKP